MKRDWMIFAGTLVFAAWAGHSGKNFLCHYTAPLRTSDLKRISWIERVMYAAALSSAESASPKNKCPRAAETLGHSVGI
jgi:hypothetical protein